MCYTIYKKTLSLSGYDFRTFGTASVTTRTVSDITSIQFALLSCFQIGDITAIIEYAMLALFFLMMAQMVILPLPRAVECCNRIGEILEFTPTITKRRMRP